MLASLEKRQSDTGPMIYLTSRVTYGIEGGISGVGAVFGVFYTSVSKDCRLFVSGVLDPDNSSSTCAVYSSQSLRLVEQLAVFPSLT